MECDKIDVTLGKLVCFFVTPIFRDHLIQMIYFSGGIKDQVVDFFMITICCCLLDSQTFCSYDLRIFWLQE